MTREIKFRAWDVRGKRMIYYGSFEFLQLNYPISVRPDSCEQLIRPLEGFESSDPILEDDALIAWNLMQYTGLLDKNGKEIYEGDVFGNESYRYVVAFEDGSFVLNHVRKELGRWGLLSRLFDADMKSIFETTELIGSIHDNPELLPNP